MLWRPPVTHLLWRPSPCYSPICRPAVVTPPLNGGSSYPLKEGSENKRLLHDDVGIFVAGMPEEEVKKVSSLSRSPLFSSSQSCFGEGNNGLTVFFKAYEGSEF
ncbi:hypothetical protein F2Q69_00037105 [Brassica cretica]|uniref:Uncharacterized protein n=1 Tax=Brassica cretica TaxID=69181 RepID=A0A8S9SJJ5_BRACR|nr:hypothetical protein F2Q69_00037105 [Brassica cretica]